MADSLDPVRLVIRRRRTGRQRERERQRDIDALAVPQAREAGHRQHDGVQLPRLQAAQAGVVGEAARGARGDEEAVVVEVELGEEKYKYLRVLT